MQIQYVNTAERQTLVHLSFNGNLYCINCADGRSLEQYTLDADDICDACGCQSESFPISEVPIVSTIEYFPGVKIF